MLHNDKRFMCSLSRIPPEVGQCCSLPTLRPSLSDSYSSIIFIPCSDLDFVQLTRKLALNRWEYLTPRKGVCKVYRRETNQESDKEKGGTCACAWLVQKHHLHLQEYGQSNNGSDNAGQELASSQAKGAGVVALNASRGAGRTRRSRRRGSGGLGGSGRGEGRRDGRRTGGNGRAGSNWEGAGTIDLRLDSGGEGSLHPGQLELRGEGQSRVLGVLGVLEVNRLKSDEAEVGKSHQLTSHQK
jgi:hypothetical protein